MSSFSIANPSLASPYTMNQYRDVPEPSIAPPKIPSEGPPPRLTIQTLRALPTSISPSTAEEAFVLEEVVRSLIAVRIIQGFYWTHIHANRRDGKRLNTPFCAMCNERRTLNKCHPLAMESDPSNGGCFLVCDNCAKICGFHPKCMGTFYCAHEDVTMACGVMACYKHKGVCDGSMHRQEWFERTYHYNYDDYRGYDAYDYSDDSDDYDSDGYDPYYDPDY
jgi:hypothetical protein